MKNKRGFTGIISILLIFGLFMTGCDESPGGNGNEGNNTFTVTYNANDASGTVPGVQTVEAGGIVTVAGQGGLTYSGRIFNGWNTNAGGTGTSYAAGSSLTVNANVILYAQWVISSGTTYTVTYNANGASGTVPAAQTIEAGINIAVAVQGGLTYSGRTFNGWNTNAGGTGTSYVAGSTLTVNANVTLYAQWVTESPSMGLVAKWYYSQEEAYHEYGSQTFEFTANGELISGGSINTYTVTSNTITVFIEEPAMVETASYIIEGTKLTIFNYDGMYSGIWNGEFYKRDESIIIAKFIEATAPVWAYTTQLTLSFDKVIEGLSADDITLIPLYTEINVSKGTLNGTGHVYTLDINIINDDFSSSYVYLTSGLLNVVVEKSGYFIRDSPQIVEIFYLTGDTNATLVSVSANGSNTQTTTQLTLTFDKSIYEFSADYIILSGIPDIIKGNLSHNNSVYTLNISGINNSGNLTVMVEIPGYIINGSPKIVQINYDSSRDITFISVSANGQPSQNTSQLTLTFDKSIPGFVASDITLSGVPGVTRGTLSGSGPTYTLDISGFTSGGTLSVSVAKAGYTITGSPKTTTIYFDPNVSFTSVSANGHSMQTSNQLTLTFDKAIPGLAASDITLSGMSVTRGALGGSGPTYTLNISGVTSNGTLSVSVSKAGYNISGSPKTTSVFFYNPPPTTATVTYVSNGGSAVTSQTVNIGSQINLPTTTRTGFNLVGWFSAASGGTRAGFTGDRFTVLNNVTLHAQWANANTGMPWEGRTVTNLTSSTNYTTGTLSATGYGSIPANAPWYRITITGSTTNPVPRVFLRDRLSTGSPYTLDAVFGNVYDVHGNRITGSFFGGQLWNSWPLGTGIYYIGVGPHGPGYNTSGTFGINFQH